MVIIEYKLKRQDVIAKKIFNKKLRRYRRKNKNKNYNKRYKQDHSMVYEHVLPDSFTIFDNYNLVIENYKVLIKKIKKSILKRVIINMENMEQCSADALMYLLVVVRNIKEKDKQLKFLVKMPTNEKIKKYIEDSELSNYLKSNSQKNENVFPLKHGDISNEQVCKDIVDFINPMVKNKFIYEIIHELMENSRIHAYTQLENDEKLGYDWVHYHDWHIFAEKVGNIVKFYFLDTGIGITKSLDLKFKEKLVNIFQKLKDLFVENGSTEMVQRDSALLKEVFEMKRNSYNQMFRGNGTKLIYDNYADKNIKNLKVLCNMGTYGDINIEINKNNDFKGTLYYFEIEV